MSYLLHPLRDLRRLKLQGQFLPKSASPRHSEKIVFMGDPKTRRQKFKQTSMNWAILIYFQENRLPRKIVYLPNNALLFLDNHDVSFFYHLCFHIKIPISLQSFRKIIFEIHVARSTTRSIFWHPSVREGKRKH